MDADTNRLGFYLMNGDLCITKSCVMHAHSELSHFILAISFANVSSLMRAPALAVNRYTRCVLVWKQAVFLFNAWTAREDMKYINRIWLAHGCVFQVCVSGKTKTQIASLNIKINAQGGQDADCHQHCIQIHHLLLTLLAVRVPYGSLLPLAATS